jgi:hypothetical protein
MRRKGKFQVAAGRAQASLLRGTFHAEMFHETRGDEVEVPSNLSVQMLLPTSHLLPSSSRQSITFHYYFDEPPIVVLPTKNSHQEEKTQITKLSAPAS